MKIVLLGATGQTGLPLVRQATSAGHEVTAYVRNVAKLADIKNDKLKVLEGDIFNADALAVVIAGADVVMSTLGFSPFSKPVTGYTAYTKAVVSAMHKTNCRRLILMHSWFTDPNSRKEASFFMRWVGLPIIGPVLDNMIEAEKYLRDDKECEDIEWTTVLPAHLTNGEVTKGEIIAVEGQYMVKDKVAKISRADVARFMIRIAVEGSHVKKTVAIAV